MADAKWLLGNWEYVFNQSAEVEEWTLSDNQITGKGFFVSQNDRVQMRKMRIEEASSGLVLIIQEENFEYFSTYQIEHLSEDSLVATTTSNIWPKKIIYTKPDANHLLKHSSGKLQQMNNVATSTFTLKK